MARQGQVRLPGIRRGGLCTYEERSVCAGTNAGEKQIHRTASRARENRGKGRNARDFARDDKVEAE
jgi:hypothetical protein